jgi:hypothetical protein
MVFDIFRVPKVLTLTSIMNQGSKYSRATRIRVVAGSPKEDGRNPYTIQTH